MKSSHIEFPYFMGTMKICFYASWKLFKCLINPEYGKQGEWGSEVGALALAVCAVCGLIKSRRADRQNHLKEEWSTRGLNTELPVFRSICIFCKQIKDFFCPWHNVKFNLCSLPYRKQPSGVTLRCYNRTSNSFTSWTNVWEIDVFRISSSTFLPSPSCNSGSIRGSI